MGKCETCGKENPSEVHTCTPGLYFSEHEKLKEICDKIGYETDKHINYVVGSGFFNIHSCYLQNVRLIIFTQEFTDKYSEFMDKKGSPMTDIDYGSSYDGLMQNLNDPVEYLYNLIK